MSEGLGTDTIQQAIYQNKVNTTNLQCLKSKAAFKPQSYNQKQLNVNLQGIII